MSSIGNYIKKHYENGRSITSIEKSLLKAGENKKAVSKAIFMFKIRPIILTAKILLVTMLLVGLTYYLLKTRPLSESELLEKTATAINKVNSYSYDLSFDFTGEKEGVPLHTMNIKNDVDIKNKKIRGDVKIGPFNMENYIEDNTIYVRNEMLWIMSEKTEKELWEDESPLSLGKIENYTKIEEIKKEKINGRTHLILELSGIKTPYLESLIESKDITLTSYRIKEWIDRMTLLPKKIEVIMDMQGEFGKIGGRLDIEFSNYGKRFSIKLPEEAKNAKTLEEFKAEQSEQ